MRFHLLRHAHAGDRSRWTGDDADRPLSDKGERQAAALAGALADEGVDRLWSSPYLRCRQTLAPLGRKLGLAIRDEPLLAEGGWGPAALDALLAEAAAGRRVAACSHGDVIPAVIATAVRRGAELHGPAEPRKAARYVLEVEAGEVARIVHVPRPEV